MNFPATLPSWDWALSSIVMFLLLLFGIYFTFRFGVIQIKGLPFIIRNTIGTLLRKEKTDKKAKNISSFQAVTTALAGTMGVGNIAGVATALVAGGPGAIFWMWVSAFFGMATKYAEIYCAVLFRKKSRNGQYYGGPMYYLEQATKSRKPACLFAVLCAISSLGIGNMTQINSVSTALQSSFSVPPLISGCTVALLVVLVIFGGVKRIGKVTEAVIPFISILYLLIAGAFLYINKAYVGPALQEIIKSAFQMQPAIGGVSGYAVSRAVHLGLSRGVFTNEAGLGSAPIAHAAADCKSPAHQAVWGIFEVFLDTIVVCTITALVILSAKQGSMWLESGLDGSPLTSAAFGSQFGNFGSGFISVSILFYAVSAMLGWCYYGEASLHYLFPNRKSAVNTYRCIFCICIVLGAVSSLTTVWRVSDILNALMSPLNLFALFLLRRNIRTP